MNLTCVQGTTLSVGSIMMIKSLWPVSPACEQAGHEPLLSVETIMVQRGRCYGSPQGWLMRRHYQASQPLLAKATETDLASMSQSHHWILTSR